MFDFILPVQHALRPFDLNLVRRKFAGSDEHVWGVVNLNGDAIAQLATSYTADDVHCYKRILRALSEEPRHQKYQMDLALLIQRGGGEHQGSQPAAPSKYTASKAEALLNSFVQDNWLHRLEINGKIMLGPKAILELKTFLLEERLFSLCTFCKEFIILGHTFSCSGNVEGKCQTVLHEQCGQTLRSCPTCKESLEGHTN